MDKGKDYKITKIEKGPLQRFKNQNLLLKKFGELGLQVYKVITGKRSVEELRKDLDMEEEEFRDIINYMEEAGMVELIPRGGAAEKPSKETKRFTKKGAAEEEEEKEATPHAERFRQRAHKSVHEEDEEPSEEASEEPQEEPLPEEEEEIKPFEYGEEKKEEEEEKEEQAEEEEPEEEKKEEEEEAPQEEEEEKEEPVSVEEEIKPEGFDFGEEKKEKEEKEEEEPQEPEEEEPEAPQEEEEEKEEEFIAPRQEEFRASAEEKDFGGELSSVERIIKERYGEVGLKVYTLIDGQRTAEEIMQETGLTESKLVEILDFMDAQGIIKLEYPERKGAASLGAVGKKEAAEDFKPILEETTDADLPKEVTPLETPIKAPMDIIKSMQLKAKLMLRTGDKGGKIFEAIDGKKDVIDIALKLDMPLYSLYEILNVMMRESAILVRPMGRADVKKKYGDDAFAVYKRYGREGLMLYELIGKELSIKQMAEKVTRDKGKVIDMFIFIHQVLGIELPIDREVLAKQLGA